MAEKKKEKHHMFVTEEEYEKYSDRWDELTSEPPHTCATCAHDGQCVDLHYCGGMYWEDGREEDDE